MNRFLGAALAGLSVLAAVSAHAYEDPIADEIQARMQEDARRQIEIDQHLNEIAAAAPWDEGDDYGYEEPPAYSAEEWSAWSADVIDAAAGRPQPRFDDARYQAFMNGVWLHTGADRSAGEYCSILFMKKGVGALIMATGGMDDPALFAFFSLRTPRPATIETARATLTQTGDAPATVSVFNGALPWAPDFGIVFFAVPTARAAIDGVLETQAFAVSMNGASVAEIEWSGGVAARDQLRACVAGKR